MIPAIGLTRMVYREAMARSAPTNAITPQMFKHFAVFTIACTAVLAMFASSAESDAGAGNAQLAAASKAETAKPAKKGIKDKRKSGGGSWGADPGEGGVSGEATAGSFEYNWPQQVGPAGGEAPIYYAPGVSPLDLAKKDPLNQKLKRELQRQQMQKPSDEQLSQLVNASLQRAGAEDSSDTDR